MARWWCVPSGFFFLRRSRFGCVCCLLGFDESDGGGLERCLGWCDMDDVDSVGVGVNWEGYLDEQPDRSSGAMATPLLAAILLAMVGMFVSFFAGSLACALTRETQNEDLFPLTITPKMPGAPPPDEHWCSVRMHKDDNGRFVVVNNRKVEVVAEECPIALEPFEDGEEVQVHVAKTGGGGQLAHAFKRGSFDEYRRSLGQPQVVDCPVCQKGILC